MKQVDCNKNVILYQGDTFGVRLVLKGRQATADDRIVWGIKDNSGQVLFCEVAAIANGEALLTLTNGQTKALPPGTHKWHARLAKSVDENLWGDVNTLFGVRDFIVKEVAADV